MDLTRAKDGMLRETHQYGYNDVSLTHGPTNNINIVTYLNLILFGISYSRVPFITLFIFITMLCGTANISWIFSHIWADCGNIHEHFIEYWQSRRTLLWTWMMLCWYMDGIFCLPYSRWVLFKRYAITSNTLCRGGHLITFTIYLLFLYYNISEMLDATWCIAKIWIYLYYWWEKCVDYWRLLLTLHLWLRLHMK